jgi:membrane associated rhomboid family serine protease
MSPYVVLDVLRNLQSLSHAWPQVTIAVLSLTAVITAAQFVQPAVLSGMERTPEALDRHQYWRLITPLFVHSGGWKQIAFNFPAIAITGYFAERIFGERLWLVLYFLPGILGEIAGYAWQPSGAGASVAGAGLLGALALWVLINVTVAQAKFGSMVVLLGAIALTGNRDIHGPPLIGGACIAWVAKRLQARPKK